MSESQTKPGALPTGIYVKGTEARNADTPARAAALAFDGFVHRDSLPKVEAPIVEPEAPVVAAEESTQDDETDPVVEPAVTDDEPVAVSTRPAVAPRPVAPKDKK